MAAMKLYPILSALSPHHVVESAPHGGLAPQLEMIHRLVNSRVAVVDRDRRGDPRSSHRAFEDPCQQ